MLETASTNIYSSAQSRGCIKAPADLLATPVEAGEDCDRVLDVHRPPCVTLRMSSELIVAHYMLRPALQTRKNQTSTQFWPKKRWC
jgi:hypothetical protein